MQTLERSLEEITPSPDPEFEAEMERRMRLGFPPPPGRGRRPGRRAFAATGAVAVLALAAATAVLQQGSDPAAPLGTTEPAGPALDASGASRDRSADALETAQTPDLATRSVDPDVVPPQPPFVPPDDLAPGERNRRVERWAQLTLASDPTEFDDIAGQVFRTAARHDGFVLRSSITQGDDGLSGGQFELRIPVGRLDTALNDLSRVATVRTRGESATDVTASFVSIRDRLRTARAVRTSLLRRLELATTDSAVRALRRRLGIVGHRITALRGQLRAARERTDYAAVSVQLVDEDSGAVAGATERAFDDAVGSLADILNFLIRALGILLPLALLGGVAWLGWVRTRRRARERALA